METPKLVFTVLVIKDTKSENYTAILKELEGVVSQGTTPEEAVKKLPFVLAGLMEANRETVEMPPYNAELMSEKELVYENCAMA